MQLEAPLSVPVRGPEQSGVSKRFVDSKQGDSKEMQKKERHRPGNEHIRKREMSQKGALTFFQLCRIWFFSLSSRAQHAASLQLFHDHTLPLFIFRVSRPPYGCHGCEGRGVIYSALTIKRTRDQRDCHSEDRCKTQSMKLLPR